MINFSLMTSIFPDLWKIPEVIPLLKEGDHEIASNNRPFSLLTLTTDSQTRNSQTRNLQTRDSQTRNSHTRNSHTRNSHTRNSQTRNSQTRRLATRRLATRRLATRRLATRRWNSLPKNIRESNSLSSFKRKIATYSL